MSPPVHAGLKFFSVDIITFHAGDTYTIIGSNSEKTLLQKWVWAAVGIDIYREIKQFLKSTHTYTQNVTKKFTPQTEGSRVVWLNT